MNIVGMEGRAEILREAARGLNLNPDKIVPSLTVLRERAAMQQMAMMQMQAQQQSGGGQGPGLSPEGSQTPDNAAIQEQLAASGIVQ